MAHAIIRSLRTSSIAQIVDKLNPLLHIDPTIHLPAEVVQEIFTYLDQKSLIITTLLSKSWRIRALDPQIWKHLFASEGWRPDYKRVWDFEEAQRHLYREKQRERKPRVRQSDAISDAESKSPKKRARESTSKQQNEDSSMIDAEDQEIHSPRRQWTEQHGSIEADDDERMEDIDANDERRPSIADRVSIHKNLRSSPKDNIYPPIKPSLLTTEFGSSPQINWQYLYKQRRRLEENWKTGRFTNFILPHPSHPHEAHTECIYTIQYVGKHLVSGSRDKTIRIWNLDTQRLVHPPLRGHKASVLCLQFDSRQAEDIIISGGGDCSVILWQFSTGKLLRKIENAHSESVLNLRFDTRHLVTCSKDRTIKVWNRNSILPTDEDYPIRGTSSSARWPDYIIDVTEEMSRHSLKLQGLSEYSLLMTLDGHTAAVNAIQILDGQIISASGDRNIIIWDLKTGLCVKTVYGHQKGIACVQFDGRRIISGSSDVTVRIFDAVTAAEVACLKGHTELVRTVQARFNDVKSSVKEDEAEARKIDQELDQARAAGILSSPTKEQWRLRNSGSRDVNDLFAYGAKLPPGGGGNKWARIVSGSYDETIIIWNRNSKGKWEPLHQLTQWEAILRAGGQPRAIPTDQSSDGRRRRGQDRQDQQDRPRGQGNGRRVARLPGQVQAVPSTRPQQSVTANTSAVPGPVQINGQESSNANQREPVLSRTPVVLPAPGQTSNPSQPLPHRTVQTTTTPPTQVNRPAATPGGQAASQAQANANANANGGQNANAHPHRDTHHQRIYKLQFCSRRLLCCSMEPIIVGWDFAAGDKEIEIASEFFGEDVEG